MSAQSIKASTPTTGKTATTPFDNDRRFTQWAAILCAILPAFNNRFFAYGETCAAAIHYGNFYSGMTRCEFAAMRKDFDELVPSIRTVAKQNELRFEAPNLGENNAPAPYARVSNKVATGTPGDIAWVYLYPLDNLPEQITLRFKLFREAAASVKSNFAGYETLLRYSQMDTQFCARLACDNINSKKPMGERTIFQRSIPKDELFPLRTAKLGSLDIPLSANVACWTTEIDDARLHDITIAQSEAKEALLELDQACAKIGIDYFLVGGSALGAIRNQGFIPWDDDADVGFLRRDYKKLCHLWQRCLAPGYFLQLPKTDPHIHFIYARLRKEGWDYITFYNEDKNFNKGVWVDLFPFDAQPKNKALAKAQRVCANTFARAAMGLKRRREYIEHDVVLDAPVASEEDARYLRRYRLIAKLFPITLCRAGYNLSARFFNPFLARLPHARFASFIPTYTTVSSDEIYPLRKAEFAGEHLNMLNHAEAFLRRQYGDFQTLPAPHVRYAQHGFKRLVKQGETEASYV